MFAFVRHGWRSWKNAKTTGLLAVMALAAGIGSATAIYTVVDAVLMKPIPWQHGERFVAIFGSKLNDLSKFQWTSNSWLDLQAFQQRTRSFDSFGIFLLREFSLTSPGQPQHLTGIEITPSFAASLGVAPVVGRWFGEAASEQGSVNLAVISNALWNRLGSDPKIVGETLTMDGQRYTVTGVMPPWFRLPFGSVGGGEFRTDVWVPLNPQGDQRTRQFGGYFSYARLAPGVSLAQAESDVKRVAAELAQEFPQEHSQYTAVTVSLLESVVKDIRPALLLLFAAAGALLLITCANVAGLLLARSVTRARETAIRVALGAAQWQLGMQYFVEGLLVALVGAAGGMAISVALVRLILSMAIDAVPRADGIGVDWSALLFAFGTAVLCSVLFSLAPLWQAVRTAPNEALSDGARGSAPARSRGLSRSLVIAEIAMAFTLLSVSAVLIAHLDRLLDTSPGFDADGVVTLTLNTSAADYPGPKQLVPYQSRLLQAIEQIPGVNAAAVVDHLPLAGCCFTTNLFPEGRPNDEGTHEVNLIVISPGYFQAMRIPVLQGRGFEESDDDRMLAIVIGSRTAKQYWPRGDALGAYARIGNPSGSRARVVGIVGSIQNRGLGAEIEPELYLSSAVVRMDPMSFVVRSPVPPATLLPEIRRSIQGVNAAQPIYETQTMREILLDSLTTERIQSWLTGFFAMAALLMAALGVYGVVSYSVRHRTVEIGTRMALGAVGRDVLGLVLGDGLKMAGYGIAMGGVAVAAAAVLLKSEVFGIRVDDPKPFLYSTGIVAGFTALACFFPGWRASLVSPMVAIRDDPGSLWRSAQTGARSLAKKVSQLVSGSADAEAVSEGQLMAELVDTSRQAESFRQAMQLALAALCEALRCESAVLLQPGSGANYRSVARVPIESAEGVSSDDGIPTRGLLAGRLRGYPHPLPISKDDLDAWSRWAEAEKPDCLPEIGALRDARVTLAVPLHAKSEMAGILLLGPPVGRPEYNASEKSAVQSCAGQFALMLENARLTDRIVEQEKVNRDVQLAVEVQKRLFPDKPPKTATVTLAGMSLPARSVGGDYYDFLDLGDQRIGIALADVAGKGVAAALIMSVVQASLRILATEDNITLSTLAAKMNRFLHRSTGSSSYATFFYGQLDERKRQLRYVNAGHNPPCLLRCSVDQSIEELPAGGMVIGLFPKSDYEEAAVDLHPGDVLIAFTDGVPEALNPADEEFGEERLKDLLRQSAHLTVGEMASRIAAELKSWIDTAAQFDDLTFVLVKVNEDENPGQSLVS